MTSKTIRLLVADDSVFSRANIKNILKDESDIEIVALCVNGQDAHDKIKILNPDVVLTDIEMPIMDGIHLVKSVMSENPLPIILMSTLHISLFDALSAGAVNFVNKPDMNDKDCLARFATKLIAAIREAAKANVSATANATFAASATITEIANNCLNKQSNYNINSKYKAIVIGASTGGTQTLTAILKDLPNNMPGIVIVQHMPAGFTKMFAQRLNDVCKLNAVEAKNGDIIQPNTIYICPGGFQARIEKVTSATYRIKCQGEERISGHCPSVDNLFDSAADTLKDHCIGVILTGMGHDGAAGMLKLKLNGAYTIGQDEESSIVYGMPKEAFKLGAVKKQLPLGAIASHLVKCINTEN